MQSQHAISAYWLCRNLSKKILEASQATPTSSCPSYLTLYRLMDPWLTVILWSDCLKHPWMGIFLKMQTNSLLFLKQGKNNIFFCMKRCLLLINIFVLTTIFFFVSVRLWLMLITIPWSYTAHMYPFQVLILAKANMICWNVCQGKIL